MEGGRQKSWTVSEGGGDEEGWGCPWLFGGHLGGFIWKPWPIVLNWEILGDQSNGGMQWTEGMRSLCVC